MSTPESGLKTLAIRLRPEIHAQLSFIAQLRGSTIGDEGLRAITEHLARAKDDPDLHAKADEARQEIEREASAKHAAIANIFTAATGPEGVPEPSRSRPRRAAKGGETTDS